MRPIVTLLTDFGTADTYVAQMKGQILSICPDATLVDVTHQVPPQDILTGALLLAQSACCFPAGTVHLVVVDPGVGTGRRMIAVEADCRRPNSEAWQAQRFVLPDNGLISGIQRQHRIARIVELSNSQFWAQSISHTFHGRDVMGPVAAHWASGAKIEQFGEAISTCVTLDWPEPIVRGNVVEGQILTVDHYGNAVSNIPPGMLVSAHGGRHLSYRVSIGGRTLDLPWVETYGHRRNGESVLLQGSHGLMEIAEVAGHAARRHRIQTGMACSITPALEPVTMG